MTPTDDTETVTFRIPKQLKSDLEVTVQAEGTTMTALLREALHERMRPRARAVVPPAFTKSFDDFLASPDYKGTIVLILVVGRDGTRLFYEGIVDRRLSEHGSLVVMRRPRRGQHWVLLRQDIVGWSGLGEGDRHAVATMLRGQGWIPMTPLDDMA